VKEIQFKSLHFLELEFPVFVANWEPCFQMWSVGEMGGRAVEDTEENEDEVEGELTRLC